MKKALTCLLFLIFSIYKVKGQIYKGIASFYSDKFNGRLTASGNVFSNKKMTAASNLIPLKSVVKVTNIKNNKHIFVYINDRMNKNSTRLIDLTKKAAKELNFMKEGITLVRVEIFYFPSYFEELKL